MLIARRQGLLLMVVIAAALMCAHAGAVPARAQGAGTPLRRVDWPSVLAADPAISVLEPGVCFPPATVTTVCVDVALDQPQAAGDTGAGNPDISGYVSIPDIEYADLDGDGEEEAVLSIESGGTAGMLGYLIYHQAAPQPTLLVIRSGYKMGVTAASGQLTESDPFYFGFEPNCCPMALWRTTYTLDGDTLQPKAPPALYLLMQDSEQPTTPAVVTVYAYYSAINEQSFDFAYSLLSAAAQQQMPYGTWKAGFASTTSVSAVVAPVSPLQAAVTVTATNSTSAGGTRAQTFTGTWTLVQSDAAPLGLLLDSASIQ